MVHTNILLRQQKYFIIYSINVKLEQLIVLMYVETFKIEVIVLSVTS
jgi:hypothetical protein